MKSVKLLSISVLSCLTILANSAIAAPQKQVFKSQRDSRYDAEEIAMIPDMPYLPPYTGQIESIRTQSFVNAHGGPAYHVCFLVNERISDVLTYYRAALKQYKWEELPGDDRADKASVSANRGNSIVTIVVTPSGKHLPASAGGKVLYRSHISIKYSSLVAS